MKLFKFFIVLLLFSIMSNMVYGAIQVNTYTASRDFSLTSAYNSVTICSCSTKYDSVTVTNTGTWPAIFSVSTNEIKSKLTLSQASFELSPGQSQEVFLYISADCTKGTEDLKITVTSNLGPQKTIEKKLTRDRCQNIEMWVANYTKEISPCQSKDFKINIHNIGPFAESYVLESNYDKYITYNTNSFNLEPNQFMEVTASLKFGCEIYGSKDIVFTAHSLNNKLTASLNAQLIILQDYDYDLSVNRDSNDTQSLNVCNRLSSTQIPVTLKNTGSVANKYTLQIDDLPNFAKVVGLDSKKFSLEPGEKKTFYIDVDSRVYRYEQKSKEITFKVTPSVGDIIKTTKLNLNFMPCYEHQVIIYDGGTSKKNPMETCSGYTYSYDVEIVNNGIYKETYRLSLEGAPSTVRLSKNKITVEPGQRDTVNLLINGPDYNTDYDIVVKATIDNEISESDDTWIKSHDLGSCHLTTIGKTEFRINYQNQEIKIPVKNNGIVDNSYIISWNGSNILNPDDQLLSLNKSQSGILIYKIQSQNKNESTYKGTLIMQDTSSATYSQEISVKLKDKSAIRKAFEYLAFGNVCKQFSLLQMVLILLVIALIIVFLVKGPHYPYNFWNRFKAKTSVLIFLIVLFLIGLILVVSMVGFPKTHEQVYNLTNNATELKYEWLQDDKFTLDVGKFFYDPENSTLRYEVTGIEHIKAVSEGNIIKFYSDLGWSGTEYAHIIAFDTMGGSVTSPEFTLMVRNVPKKSTIEMYDIYCWYFNLAIYAIILVLIFIAVFVKQQRRGRKK